MRSPLQLGLRAGERIYINGAVIRVDRKVRLQLINDAKFLLESHVMSPEEANTPLRQLYFLVQALLMDPGLAEALTPGIQGAIAVLRSDLADDCVRGSLQSISERIVSGSVFEALKGVRALIAHEAGEAR